MQINSRSDSVSAYILAGLLVILFILTALAALMMFNVERRAFDSETYKQELVNQKFYLQFPYLLSDLLVANIDGQGPAFLGHLSADQWRELVQAVLPEDQLQAMTEDTLDQFFAFLNGETDSPHISLTPLKSSLAGPAGLKAALTIIRAQPDCTVQQILKVLGSFGQELCNPPQEILDLLHPVIQGQMQIAASVIPDEISFIPDALKILVEPDIKSLKIIRFMMRFSPVIPVLILLVLTLITVRTFRSWFAWWGSSFFLTGLFGVPLGLTGAPLFRWLLERWLSQRIPVTFPTEVAVSLRMVVDAAFNKILKPAVWESLVLFIIGLVMILISIVLTYREKKRLLSRKQITFH
jgi:hypothetical protein